MSKHIFSDPQRRSQTRSSKDPLARGCLRPRGPDGWRGPGEVSRGVTVWDGAGGDHGMELDGIYIYYMVINI